MLSSKSFTRDLLEPSKHLELRMPRVAGRRTGSNLDLWPRACPYLSSRSVPASRFLESPDPQLTRRTSSNDAFSTLSSMHAPLSEPFPGSRSRRRQVLGPLHNSWKQREQRSKSRTHPRPTHATVKEMPYAQLRLGGLLMLPHS